MGFIATDYRSNRVFPLTNPYISNIMQQRRWSYLELGSPVIQPRIFFELRVRLSPSFVELHHGVFFEDAFSSSSPPCKLIFNSWVRASVRRVIAGTGICK